VVISQQNSKMSLAARQPGWRRVMLAMMKMTMT